MNSEGFFFASLADYSQVLVETCGEHLTCRFGFLSRGSA